MSTGKIEQLTTHREALGMPTPEFYAQQSATEKTQRRYLPTFADLIDRFSITLMKSIFIHEHRENYEKEMELLMHDISLLMSESSYTFNAEFLKAVMVVMLTNREIWLNESLARKGANGHENRLKFTHSINGQRNAAKNVVSKAMGERLDWKVDAFSADLIEEFGHWRIYGHEEPKT
jgi:hypothetical protein